MECVNIHSMMEEYVNMCIGREKIFEDEREKRGEGRGGRSRKGEKGGWRGEVRGEK